MIGELVWVCPSAETAAPTQRIFELLSDRDDHQDGRSGADLSIGHVPM
jgi:hypothetical protein